MTADAMRYLRPAKRAVALQYVEGYADMSGRLAVEELECVTLSPIGVVPDVEPAPHRLIDDGEYCTEVSDGVAEPVISGHTLYGGYFRPKYGHFLMNSTARLWPLFQPGGERYSRVVFFADEWGRTSIEGNLKEFMELAGILDRCVVLPASGSYGFEHLTVAEPAIRIGRHVSAELLLPFERVRREALRRRPATASERGIILTRSRWSDNRRTQINVELIEEIFTANGYEAVSPERISLTELISRMEGAPEVVSFCGSTAHNILFTPGKRLVSLERVAVSNLYQMGIQRLPGADGVYVDCFYQPMVVSSCFNHTIYGLTEQLEAYLRDHGLSVPADVARRLTVHSRREFRRHLRYVRRLYGYGLGLNEWETADLPAIAEAYRHSLGRYGRYINRCTPVAWYDYLSPIVWYRLLRRRP